MFNGKVQSVAPTRKHKVRAYNFKEVNTVINPNLLDFDTPAMAVNLRIQGGKLITGLGVVEAQFPDHQSGTFTLPKPPTNLIEQVFVYRRTDRQKNMDDSYLIIRTKKGDFYKVSLNRPDEWEYIYDISSKEDVVAINFRFKEKDVIFFCNENMVLTMYDGDCIKINSNAPKITSMTEHYGRMFVSSFGEGDIWFSDDFNPMNWNVSLSGAGYIRFSDNLGNAIKVLSFNDYVYVFREHSIYRLTAFGDQSNFELTKVLELGSKIYAQSITICRDKIMFLTDNGMYSFDGYSLKKVATNLQELTNVEETNLQASCFNDKYVVIFYNPNFSSDPKFIENNCMITYNISTDKVDITKDLPIIAITPYVQGNISNCLCIVRNYEDFVGMFDYSNRVFNQYLTSSYRTVKSYLGNLNKDKYIRKLAILTKYPVNISLCTDKGTFNYDVKGGDKPQYVKINKKARWVQLVFNMVKDIDISGFELEYDEVV